MKAFIGALTPAWQPFLLGGNYDTWLLLDEDSGGGVIVQPAPVNDPRVRVSVNFAQTASANRTNQMCYRFL
jgi:hypothetical protein